MKKVWFVQPVGNNLLVCCDAGIRGRQAGVTRLVNGTQWALAPDTVQAVHIEHLVAGMNADLERLESGVLTVSEKVAKAVRVYRNIVLTGHANTSVCLTESEQPKVNVLYVGDDEYIEIKRDTRLTFGGQFMGLRVVRVRLETYLQVAYVEGVQ